MRTIFTGASLVGLAIIYYFVSATQSYDWPVKNSPANAQVVVALGDSLTFGQGASEDQNYPAHLSQLMGQKVVNLGRNGDTVERAASRLSQVTRQNPDVVLITLGGNDILKKVPVEKTLEGLREIFTKLHDKGAMVVYLGLNPPVVGGKRMAAIGELCREHEVLYVPAAMKGMWADPKLMSDTIHPNGEGYRVIAARVYDRLRTHLK